ncbi:MAG: T9SS type A sorting domain-containing protein [Bacteroidota bacterium]
MAHFERYIVLLISLIIPVIGIAQNPIPGFVYNEVVNWPPEGISYFTIDEDNDGIPDNMIYDTATGELSYFNLVSIGNNTVGDPVIQPLQGLLIECFVPPFVSSYHISIDEPVLAAGTVAIRLVMLEVTDIYSPSPTSYDESTFPDESYWRWHISANRNWQFEKDSAFFGLESVTRIPAYNGMNFGYSTPPENYWGPIVFDQVHLGWRIMNADSADFMNWVHNAVSIMENETTYESDFKVYPNPADEIIIFEKRDQSIKEVGIYDMSGKMMKIFRVVHNQTSIPVSDLKRGLYIVKSGIQAEKVFIN